MQVGGTAIVKAIDKIIAKGKKIAAHLLETSESDIEFENGQFVVPGTDKAKAFGENRPDCIRARISIRWKIWNRVWRKPRFYDRPEELHVPGGHLHLRG